MLMGELERDRILRKIARDQEEALKVQKKILKLLEPEAPESDRQPRKRDRRALYG